MTPRRCAIALSLVLLCLLAVEAYGFAAGHLFSQNVWDPIGMKRFLRFAGSFLAVAVPLLLIAPWAFVALVCGVVVFLTTLSTGPLAVLATAFFLISSWALGSLLLRNSSLSALVLGIAVYICLMNYVARLPVNYPFVWLVLLSVPIALCLWGRRFLLPAHFPSLQLRTFGERAAFAILAFVLMMHWLVALKPEQSADGLAMHLAIATNIAAHHAMTFEPTLFVWSAMPMGGDWIYAIVYLLGGEFAARLLNFAMLLLVEALLYSAVRRWVPRSVAFLLLALFASTPLVQLVTGSLLVENTIAALVLGVMTALWQFGETGERKFLYLAAAVAGTALTVKFSAVSFLIVALPFAFPAKGRHWKPYILAAGLVLVAALPPFAIAWSKTRNPIFPFRNESIHSPLLDPSVQFRDNQFRKPLTWHTPADLTFHTHDWYESQDGAFGFQYLLLAPLGLLALPLTRRRVAASAGVVGLAGSILVLGSEPNARYVYAAMPLLLVPLAALYSWAHSQVRWLSHLLTLCTVACVFLNIYFIPASGWYHKDFFMRAPFSRTAAGRYIRETVPIRYVVQYLNRLREPVTPPYSAVLLTAENDIADVQGDVYEDHWHQFVVIDTLRRADSRQAMLRALEKWNIEYVIGRKPETGAATDPEALEKLIEACTVTEYDFAQFRLSRLEASRCK